MRSLRDDRGMRNRSGGGVHNSSNQPFHGQPGGPQQGGAQQNMGQPPQQAQQQQQPYQHPQPQSQQPSPGMIPPQQQQQQQAPQQQQQQPNQHPPHPQQPNNNLQPLEPYAPPPAQQNYQASPSIPPPQAFQQRSQEPPQFDQAKVYQYLSEKWISAKQRSADMSIPEKDRPKVYMSQHNQWGQGHVQNVHLQTQNGSIEQLIRKKLDEKKCQVSGSLSQQNSLDVDKEKLPNGTAVQLKGKWK